MNGSLDPTVSRKWAAFIMLVSHVKSLVLLARTEIGYIIQTEFLRT
jgi:hypothetical protein